VTVYTTELKGHPTATGETYEPNKMTAAVLPGTIPLKSIVTVTLDSDPSRSVDVYVNDHGLYQRILNHDGTYTNHPLPGRVIDLSTAAFKALTGKDYGKVMVTVTVKGQPK
jgi:rare lipoprotein A (peptidoglycan hydrolase)